MADGAAATAGSSPADGAIPVNRLFAVEKTSAPSSMETQDDVASEWEQAFAVDDTGEPAETASVRASRDAAGDAEIAETVEEVGFYLEHFMIEQARAAFRKLEKLTRDSAVLDPLRKAIAASATPAEEPPVEIAEINADNPETFAIEVDIPATGRASDVPAPAQPAGERFATLPLETPKTKPIHFEVANAQQDNLGALVADLEGSLGDSFLAGSRVESGTKAAPAAEPGVHTIGGAAAAPAPAFAGPETTMSDQAALAHPLAGEAHDTNPSGNIDLSEMFGELRHELEEGGSPAEDDPETHYNLGVAFREMGLLDEAITELQKVCSAIEKGHAFPQVVQSYTWLAQCFLDKGVPEAAIRWYEKALNIPGLDNEARVAINYELGAACESAQDKPGALRHFTYVYGANIDYRDVAERIHALKS